MSLRVLINTCNELKAISGTADKKKFLAEHKYDSEFTELLHFLLDPRIVTGISNAKLNQVSCKRTDEASKYTETLSLYDFTDYLTEHNTGTKADVRSCQWYLDTQCETKAEREFVSKVICKTLKLGVDVKTVNAVYGNDFIRTHEVQQGCPRDKLRLKSGEFFALTQKLNGVRGTFVNGRLVSRQGTAFSGLEHIERDLNTLLGILGEDFVFDGELIRDNPPENDISDNENFRVGTGIINSDDADKSCIRFKVFDMLPAEEFEAGESKLTYFQRRKRMDELARLVKHLDLSVEIVPVLYYGSDVNQIEELLRYADSRGWEGLMLNKDVPYYCKRHTGLIKIKTFLFSDLKVVGYAEGTNKYEGALGSLVVDYKGNSVAVGSGFTDEQRTEFWEKRDELIGKIVEVKYKEESEDKNTGLKSLQFPIFMRFRDDKTTESLES